MQIRTLNADKFISLYNVREVTSYQLTGPGSLFDPDIFGQRNDKEIQYGYINLKGYYIDPSTYGVASRVFRELLSIVDGSKKYTINKDGSLEVDPENGHTGLRWFYENLEDIRFNKIRDTLATGTNRMQSKLMKKAFLKLKRGDIFISKLIVMPMRYRDINTEDEKNVQIDELNQMYMDLIKAVATKERFKNTDERNSTILDYKIQQLLQSIYEFQCSKIFGKTGAQRSLALSRSVDNCTNSVIVAPEVKLNDIIGKSDAALDNAKVPLHHILNMHPVHTLSATKQILMQLRNVGLIQSDLDEFEYFYNEVHIKEEIENYYNSPAMRFEPVKQPNGELVNIWVKHDNDEKPISRPIIWLEIFYLATQLYINNVRGILTRYPVTTKNSTVPVRWTVATLVDELATEYIYIDEEAANNNDAFLILEKFPQLSKYLGKVSQSRIPSLFSETTQFSNMYLDGLDGDYDGDRVNLRTIYSKEGVKEIDDYMNSAISALHIDGTNVFTLSNECVQGLWNLTTDKHLKLGKVKVTVDMNLKEFFNRKDYTLNEIIQILNKYHPEAAVTYENKKTTLGRVIFNEVCFHHIKDKHTFVDEAMTKGALGDLMNKYASYLLDPIESKWFTIQDFKLILNSAHDLGFGICDAIASTLDYDMLIKKDTVYSSKKKEIFKDIDRIVAEKDSKAMLAAEEKLVSFMKEHYKDNQMADMYDSGCKPKWDNDFKTLKGSIGISPIPGSSDFTIVDSNLKEGLSVKDIQSQANLQIYGAYNRAVETAKGGYLTKKMYSAFQSTCIYQGDCKTKSYLEIVPSKKKEILYRWVLDGNEEVLVTVSNINKFLNKKIKMRSPIFCKHKKGYCRKCAGEMLPIMYKMDYKNLEVLNIGQFIADVGNSVLNANMKKTHDLTQKLYEINDLDDFLL